MDVGPFLRFFPVVFVLNDLSFYGGAILFPLPLLFLLDGTQARKKGSTPYKNPELPIEILGGERGRTQVKGWCGSIQSPRVLVSLGGGSCRLFVPGPARSRPERVGLENRMTLDECYCISPPLAALWIFTVCWRVFRAYRCNYGSPLFFSLFFHLFVASNLAALLSTMPTPQLQRPPLPTPPSAFLHAHSHPP